MIGEMNASHMGIGDHRRPVLAGGDRPVGLEFDRAAYEQRGELRVTDVVPLSPAAASAKRSKAAIRARDRRHADRADV